MKEELSFIEVYEYLKKEFKSFLKLLWTPILFLYGRFLFFLYLCVKNYKLFLILFILFFTSRLTIFKKLSLGDEKKGFYEAEAVLELNFGSSYRLYKSINYYKKLVVSKDYGQLSKVLTISKDEAKSIKQIEIAPVVKVQDIIEKYNTIVKNRDSIFDYDNFSTHIKDEEYRSHSISIRSKNKYIFKKIEKAIIFDLLQATDIYEKEQKSILEVLKRKENLLSKSLDDISEVVASYLKSKDIENKKTSSELVPKGYMSFVNTESSKKGDKPIEEMSFLKSRLVISDLIEVNRKNIFENSYIVRFISSFPSEGVLVTNIISRGGIIADLFIAIVMASVIIVARQMVFFLSREIVKKEGYNI